MKKTACFYGAALLLILPLLAHAEGDYKPKSANDFSSQEFIEAWKPWEKRVKPSEPITVPKLKSNAPKNTVKPNTARPKTSTRPQTPAFKPLDALKYYNPSLNQPTPKKNRPTSTYKDQSFDYNYGTQFNERNTGAASSGIEPSTTGTTKAPSEPAWTSGAGKSLSSNSSKGSGPSWTSGAGSTLSSGADREAGPIWTSGKDNSSDAKFTAGSSSPSGPQWREAGEASKLPDISASGDMQAAKAGTPRFVERRDKKTLSKLSREQLLELSTSSTSGKTDSTAGDTSVSNDAVTGTEVGSDISIPDDLSRQGTPADLSSLSQQTKSRALLDPDNEFSRTGGRGLTDAEWQSIASAKKAKQTKSELSIVELEKLDCPALSKQAEGASSAYASQCYQLMHKKGCFLNAVVADGGMPRGGKRLGPDPNDPATAIYEDPINKSIAAAIDSMNSAEEAAPLYEKLGLEPPKPWGEQFLDALSEGIRKREEADSAHADNVEDIAGMLDGYEGPVQSDGPVSLDLEGLPGQHLKDVNAGNDPDTNIEGTEVLEDLEGGHAGHPMFTIQGDDQDKWQYMVNDDGTSGTISQKTQAEYFGTAPPKKWSGKGTPVQGMVNNDGQIYDEDTESWMNEDLWVEEQQRKKRYEVLLKDKETANEEAWDKFWKENADPPLDHEIYEADRALASTKAKWDILDRLWEKKYDQKGSGFNDISILQIDALEKRMENAIQKGASPDELNGLYKGFVRHHMVETGLMTAAHAEDEEITANFYLEQSQNALSAATGTIGFAGVVAEAGAYTLKGYLEGDTKAGVWEALEMNIPTSTVKFFKDYLNDKPNATPTGFIGALLQDALVGYGTFNTVKGLTSGGGWSKTILSEDLTPGGKNIAADAFELLALKSNKLQASELDMLKGRSRGLDKVNRFNGVYAEALTDAKIKGRPFKVDDYPDLKDAGLEIFSDKHAMHMLNNQHNFRLNGSQAKLIEQFDSVMDSVYKKSDKIMKNGLSADYAEILHKKGVNFENLSVKEFKPTNAKVSTDPKLKSSYDRDVSATIQYIENITDSNGNVIGRKLREIDVPEEMMQKHLSQGMWESAGKPDIKKFDPHGVSEILYSKPKIDPVTKKPMIDPDTGQIIMIKPSPAEAFIRIHDQAPTWRLSSDAYGHVKFQLDSAITYKSELFLDNMDLGYTTAYKGFEWKESGHKLRVAAEQALADGNPAKASYLRSTAQAMEEEGMRQWTKQWKNQMIPGVNAVRNAAAELGMKNLPKGPPPKLATAIEIMEDTGTLKNGVIVTPETVTEQLKLLGYRNGTDDVGKSIQDYMQSMQQYVSDTPQIKTKLAATGLAQRTQDNMNMIKKFGVSAPQVDLKDSSKVFRGQQRSYLREQ